MLQRFCFLRRRASHSGMEMRWGGTMAGIVPDMRCRGGIRVRGRMVIGVDSARKATSSGPIKGCGYAIIKGGYRELVATECWWLFFPGCVPKVRSGERGGRQRPRPFGCGDQIFLAVGGEYG